MHLLLIIGVVWFLLACLLGLFLGPLMRGARPKKPTTKKESS